MARTWCNGSFHTAGGNRSSQNAMDSNLIMSSEPGRHTHSDPQPACERSPHAPDIRKNVTLSIVIAQD